MQKKTISVILCLVLLFSLVIAGCGGNKPAAKKDKDSLVWGIGAEPATMDPFATNDSTAQYLHYQIFDTLVRQETDGKLVPSLADSWTVSPDGMEIIFNLHKNVKFHNGDAMTADDVAYSINKAIASPYTSKMTSSMKKAEVVDPNTVKLVLKYPYSAILGCLSSANLSIVSKKAMEADPKGFARNPVGTGAYKLVDWKSGEKMVLQSFPEYFRGAAKIKNLTVRIITDFNTAVVTLEKGETDILDTPPKAERKHLMEDKKLKYYEGDQACYYLIAFNNKKSVFSNQKLREAVSYAIDRQSILQGALEGVGKPIEAAMVPGTPQYPDNFKANPYDVEKAKQLMAEAGYPNGLSVKMKTIQSPTYTKPTEVLQEQLSKIGIKADIEVMERASWLKDVTTDANYEITFWAIPITVMDADLATYSAFHSSMIGGAGNFTEVSIPELDALLEKGRVSQSEQERKDIYRQVCQIIKDKSVVIPLFTGTRCIAANKDLKGVTAVPNLKYYVYDYSWE